MNRSVQTLAAMVLGGAALAAVATGCEILAAPDRSKLPHATTSTGSGGMTTTVSTGGTGGTPTCTGQVCAQVAECPAQSSACVLDTCTAGCCGTTPAPMGTTCKESGGKKCDGMGACVGCLAAADCPAPSSVCKVAACDSAAHTCGTAGAPKGMACSEGGGKMCDGAGACVVCLAPTDCPTPSTACKVAVCSATTHICGTTPAPLGTTCTDNGGVVCDGAGLCVSDNCTDGVKDADETDVDCGGSCGASCSDTSPQQACKVAGDCINGVCTGMLCQPPTCSDGVFNGNETDQDCGGPDCDPLGKTCPAGGQCTAAADCKGAAGCNGTTFTAAADCVGGVCVAGSSVDCGATDQACDPAAGCVECAGASDCPAPPDECTVATCNGNVCGKTFPDQTHTLSTGQTGGDCQKKVCDGAGHIISVNDATDVPPPSGTVCATSPACTGSPTLAPSYTFTATGTDCTADGKLPAHVCGDTSDPAAKGTCVDCNSLADCAGDAGTCTNHKCQ